MPRLYCKVDLEPRMPLKLKGILMDWGVEQRAFAAAIVQTTSYAKGRPLSLTAAANLVVRNIWPSLTPKDEIVRQTHDFLRGIGVPEAVIATAFELDPDDTHHYQHPKGCHAGQHGRAHQSGNDAALIDPVETEMLTPQAKKQFQLFRDPFTEDVQGPEDVFLSADQRYIREVLFATARHGGFVAVAGESGSGKTTLRRDMLDRIQREALPVIAIQPRSIDKGVLTASAICHAIIDDLNPGAKVPRSLEAQARAVERALTESSRAGNSHVLIIEEAHDLNIQTLKYLKRFWELEDGFKKLLAIILVGQPELKAKLDERRNFEAREVIRRCEIAELMPLDNMLEDYLRLKFNRVGADYDAIFAHDAADGIRRRLTRPGKTPRDSVSMVYPLTVNRLVVRALNLAAELGQPRIDANLVKEI
ncbi:MAG: AAA family ATPase [Thiobacillus sp.]|uniref:ExeA family protein n=1 Tax=Thiobacillus sp. TaxID=924 RepID=UPI0028944F0E|nr:AAA family ATPase [Thiobacillus sp.]MDT3707460.1 AAA family ATPase [Thiobacillus sp.]